MPNLTPLTDERRLAELDRLAILDTPPETDYDDLAALAAAICHSRVGAVNFVDGTRHFTKAVVGLDAARGGSIPNELSFCAATIECAEAMLVISDTRSDARWLDHPLVVAGPRVGFYAGAPILARGERVGVVCSFGNEARDFTAEELAGLAALARQASGLLELRRRNLELHGLAVTDALTGPGNRTLLLDRLDVALAGREGTDREVGVLFCDVDGFKDVNDRLGHAAGDRLLCDIATHLRGAVRATDTVARIAGDEFVVVCPSLASAAELDAVVDRVVAGGDHRRRTDDDGARPRLSVGAVLARAGEGPADVLRRADEAMYAAKAMSPSRRTALRRVA